MPNSALELGFLTVATVAALFLAVLGLVGRKSRGLGRPPTPSGPKPSWFGLGSPDIPEICPWHRFTEWGKIYGDLIFYRAYGDPVLVINSAKIADDLLDKRSAIYSSRPIQAMTMDLMGWDWSFVGMKYGDTWRRYRGLFQKYFHSRATQKYEPISAKGVQTLLRHLNHTPNDFEQHLRRNAAALVMKISYGHDIAENGDIYVTLSENASLTLNHASIYGTYMVDYLPILKYVPTWFPGAGFKRKAYEWRKLSQAMLERPFDMVKERVNSGTAVPCVTTTELEKSYNSGNEADAKMIQGVAAVSYLAGADTTVASTLTFLLAVTLDPDIQRKAQAEIDHVVGTDRLPTINDRDKLPFVSCIVWEALRWNPVTPLSVPHATVQDDIYEGYWIPKGTTIQPNVWAMLHDERKYPDSLKFKPERFEDMKRNAEMGINDLPLIGFGFGRRVCPGRWLALNSLWLTIASILTVYDVVKAKDEHGNVIEPAIEFTTSTVSRPKPFQCMFIPRSEEALALIQQTEDELSFS